jgi:hypothetical protein
LALLLGLAFLLPVGSAHAKCGEGGHTGGYTNAGTKFILVYMENIDGSTASNQYQDIYLASLGDIDTVTITCKAFPSFRKTLVLQKNASQSYRISNDIAVLVNGSETVSPNAVMVNSTAPIICYGMNHKQYSADAWLALPVQVVGKEYRIMSYTNSAFSDVGAEPSEFAVAAFENQTKIDITPADRTQNGVAAHTVIHITLDSGECYQVIADGSLTRGDLTGSMITSDKPIAVFGGHMRAEIPYGYSLPDGTGETSRDHLTEQMPPVTSWGKAWLTTRISELGLPDLVRILALNDNTEIKINGTPWRTLPANGYVDTMIDGPISFEASGPCLVGQFAHTTKTQLGTGDPFMAIVPPIDQVFNDFTFFISTDAQYTEHHIMLAVDNDARGTVNLDGSPISPAYTTFTAGGKQFAVAIVDVTPGSHRLTTGVDESKGAILVGYGYGPADSYGYSAGSLLKPISGIIAKKTSIGNIATAQQIVSLRNLVGSRIYLDSVSLTVNGQPTNLVNFKERVWQDIDHVDVNGEQLLHIDASRLDKPTLCTMKVYHHVYTHDYCRDDYFKPTEIAFYVYPTPAASVPDNGAGNAEISVYPNPVRSTVHLECVLPFTSFIVRNALGSEVISGVLAASKTTDVDLHVLTAGSYWIDLLYDGHLVGRVPVHKSN